jgi:hypothetical protein
MSDMLCRYCNKDVTSYTEQPRITVTFDDNNKWGYEGPIRVCACKGIDPLNRDTSARKEWVVYNNKWLVCDINPYTDSMMQKSAEISDDGKYRYKLSRIWKPTGQKILFIMINPSSASAIEDDRTINKLLEITKLWKYDGFYVGNLYPYRSSKPADLKNIQIPEEVNAINMKSIEEMAAESSLIVYAWGTKGPDARQKEPKWLRLIVNKDVHCINKSVKNVPMHPNQWGPNIQPIPKKPTLFRSTV